MRHVLFDGDPRAGASSLTPATGIVTIASAAIVTVMICRGRIDVVAAARARNLLGRSAEENNEVYLDKPIMVHNVYFTLLPDRSGGFRRLKDFYGHDRRIIEALEGESLRWIPDYDPGAHSQAPRGGNRAIDPLQQSLVFAFRAGGCPQALLFDLSQLAWG